MNRAVGDVKAGNLMQRILPPDHRPPSPLELAKWLNPQALIPLVREEHPQAIAVLLVQLDPEVAAEVLHGLPAEIQPQVVHRIATLGPVAPEALAMLEDLLGQRIRDCHGSAPLAMGGPMLAGWAFDMTGDYRMAWQVFLAVLLAATALTFIRRDWARSLSE